MVKSSVVAEFNGNRSIYFNGTTSPELDPLSIADHWILIGLETFTMLITLIGNSLVILSVILVKSLRKPQNYLLLSLAFADLLVGGFVMPLSILLQVEHRRWPLGTLICDLWVCGESSRLFDNLKLFILNRSQL